MAKCSRNLRQEFLTRDELDAKLREAGVASITQVRRAFLDSDGNCSVVTDAEGSERTPDIVGRPGS